MPAPEQLPDDLKDLVYRNGFELSHTRWDSDVREMTKRLGLGKPEGQVSQHRGIAAPRAGSPVGNETAVAAGSPRSSMRVAVGAVVTLLVLVSLGAWLMSGGDGNSTGQAANLSSTGETTRPTPGEPDQPAAKEPPASPPKEVSGPARPAAPARQTTAPVVEASFPVESTLRSLVVKEGGTPGTQRSPQLDHQETFATKGALKMEFEFGRGACSKARLHIFIDGKLVRQTDFIVETTGLLDLGPVSPGRHTLTLSPEGQEGGCNSGTLGSWGGTLTLHVGA